MNTKGPEGEARAFIAPLYKGSTAHGDAAVHVQADARDVFRLIRGQKKRGVCHVQGFAHAAERICFTISSLRAGSHPSVSGVVVGPGAMAFTVMP